MGDLSGDVRFTYFLRDPVARLWSHIRMIARRRGGPGSVDPGRAAHILKRTIAGDEPHIAARSDYRAILLRLGEAIRPGKLFIMFYEEMLSTSGIAKICQFLGLRMHDPDLSKLVHVGPVLAMTPDQHAAARAWLRPQYEFANEIFGSLPEPWLPVAQGGAR